jgi:hypothetical protein
MFNRSISLGWGFTYPVLVIVACFVLSLSCQLAEPAGERLSAGLERLAVHEWGTFTCLQDEDGNAIRGINGDDEPVPQFVHRIANLLILSPRAEIPILYQGAPACHPDVTMRLETPVVYFHPARGAKLPLTLNLDVAFFAGWLSEYYPNAEVEAPGVTKQQQFGRIQDDTVGRLQWTGLRIGTSGNGPTTRSQVWLAPRAVEAPEITTTEDESERFLFYRGVGHVDSPVRIARDSQQGTLRISAKFPMASRDVNPSYSVPRMWLVNVREDKSCAFRDLPGANVAADGQPHELGSAPAAFADTEYVADNLSKVTAEMRAELSAEGLFADEADALLNTWKLSYFQSSGLRLFYMLPRPWTDRVLPMHLSVDADVVRVMVGRIELVTPHQRSLLQEIAEGPASKPAPIGQNQASAKDFQAYEQLGRFRNALLLDEVARRPTGSLRGFIGNYGLNGYQWSTTKE